MKNKYPASHKLAIKNKSFVEKRKKIICRCTLNIDKNEREIITINHWKPISKLLS